MVRQLWKYKLFAGIFSQGRTAEARLLNGKSALTKPGGERTCEGIVFSTLLEHCWSGGEQNYRRIAVVEAIQFGKIIIPRGLID